MKGSRKRRAEARLPPPSDARAVLLGAPGRAPATFDESQPDERNHGEPGEDQEARRRAAGVLLGEPERGGEVEPADAAGEPDQPGHHPDLLAEPLRHELEHRAVADAE